MQAFRHLSAATASEDEPGLKWDRCIADTILKTGAQFNCQYNELISTTPQISTIKIF